MNGVRTALYCRLSKDDEKQGDSESIKTQKAMLSQYAAERGFIVVGVYVDDGWSGLYFDRPDFQRMVSDIEAGKIDIVITKDLSRLGRDHLQVGHYTEIYFPMKGVRYIAVNDNVDTANKNNDIAAIKNVMNEFYSRDNSRKIKSSIRARAKAGLYRSSFNPIGYKKAPDNRNKLIVDEETAWIVKRIFELVLAGNGPHRIVTIFRDEQVPCPSWWLHSRGEKDYSDRFEGHPEKKYEWSHTVIRNIVSNPLYLGSTVMCKTETVFKAGICKKNAKKDQVKVDGTHEALISQEDFDRANDMILSRKRADCSGNVSIFSGLIKCADCGKAMSQRYWTRSHVKIFVCGTYAANTKACTDHRIFYDDLYEAVLSDIREMASLAFADKDRAIQKAMDSFYSSNSGEANQTEMKLKKARKRYDDVTQLFDRLYEDALEGRITPLNQERLMQKYQAEQDQLLSQIEQLEKTLKSHKDAELNALRWAEEMAKLTELQELDAELLNRIIERIEVSNREDLDGEVRQKVKIIYRFSGFASDHSFSASRYLHPSGEAWHLARSK